MNFRDFMHNDPDECHDKDLTLHDCIADKISIVNGFLYFYFPNGFWITDSHKDNEYKKTIRTDSSLVEFAVKDTDDILLQVFTSKTFCRLRKSIVENWNVEQLLSTVNSNKCTIEFITQYRSYFEQMWHCIIHSNKKPYYRECQLYLPGTKATFFWNNLRPECEW